jgi:hypothetical protein
MIEVGDLVRMKKRPGVSWHTGGRAVSLGIVIGFGKTKTVCIVEPGKAAVIRWPNGVTTVTGISMVEQAQ